MADFKSGDKVVCIEDNLQEFYIRRYPLLNEILTVRDVLSASITTEEIKSSTHPDTYYSFKSKYFILEKEWDDVQER